MIEAAAENLVEALLFEYPLLTGVTLELKSRGRQSVCR